MWVTLVWLAWADIAPASIQSSRSVVDEAEDTSYGRSPGQILIARPVSRNALREFINIFRFRITRVALGRFREEGFEFRSTRPPGSRLAGLLGPTRTLVLGQLPAPSLLLPRPTRPGLDQRQHGRAHRGLLRIDFCFVVLDRLPAPSQPRARELPVDLSLLRHLHPGVRGNPHDGGGHGLVACLSALGSCQSGLRGCVDSYRNPLREGLGGDCREHFALPPDAVHDPAGEGPGVDGAGRLREAGRRRPRRHLNRP